MGSLRLDREIALLCQTVFVSAVTVQDICFRRIIVQYYYLSFPWFGDIRNLSSSSLFDITFDIKICLASAIGDRCLTGRGVYKEFCSIRSAEIL